jgi:hypothetical protein
MPQLFEVDRLSARERMTARQGDLKGSWNRARTSTFPQS